MLLLFSLSGKGILAAAEPSGNTEPAAEAERTAVFSTIRVGTSSEPESEARTVYLEANGGSVDTEFVELKSDGTLPTLPTPVREGWTFDGWYTEKVNEAYISGGDETSIGSPAVGLATEGEVIAKIREELREAGMDPEAVSRMTDSELKGKKHTWVVLTNGQRVTSGNKLSDEVETLYARYTPKTYTIKFHSNGWKGSTSAFNVIRQYGAVCSSYNLNSREPWTGHTLEGWSREPNGEIVIPEAESGETVYRVGEGPLWLPESGTEIHLYAVGTIPKVESVSVYKWGRLYHYPDHWQIDVRYTLYPSSEKDTKVTWSVDRTDIASISPSSMESYQATLSVWNPAAITDAINITVTVTSENGVSGSAAIPIGHSWYESYSYKPNCQHTGYVVYKCNDCNRTWQKNLEKTEHTFTHSHIAATCTTGGYDENVCSVCGLKQITNQVPAAGHNWGAEQIVTGCGGEVVTKTCQTCGFVESNIDENNANHQWETTPTIDKKPTCGQAGSQSYHCAVCGLQKGSESIPADPSLHRWAGWVETTKAAIGVMGVKERYCLTCKVKETQDIPALLPAPSSVPDADTSQTAPNPDSNNSESSSTGSTDSGNSGSGNSGSGSSGSGNSGSGNSDSGSSGSGNSGSGSYNEDSSSGNTSLNNGNAAAAQSAPEPTPLPIVPTMAQRAAMPEYVEVGNWDKAADGTWSFKDGAGQVYTDRWAAIYNPYAAAAAEDAYGWFRFDATGHMITGWYTDPATGYVFYMNPLSDGTQGKMMTGWVTIDGKEYYFNPVSDGNKGRMYRNEVTPDGHFVGPDGAKIW